MKSLLTSFLFLLIFLSTVAGQPDQRIARLPKVNHDWLPGFISITELSGGIGIGITDVPYSKYYYGITTLAGYQFTRNIKAGAGLGVEFHNEGTLFPLFIDARYSFNAQQVVPFFSATGGLGMSFENFRDQTYVFVNPMFGIMWVAANRTGVLFSAGMMMMSGQFTRNSFINFKIGIQLKGK
jgi:hypothetical protein